MRARAVQYEGHAGEPAPNVLDYEAELVLDGRTLAKPVNYLLARIVPPEGEIDAEEAALRRRRSARRPRAGHRRLQGRQRDRRGDAGRPSLLLRRLPARPRARPDDRGRGARQARLPRGGRRAATRRPRASRSSIGNCQAGWAVLIARRDPPRALRADHGRRLAALLLGRRPRQGADALLRRAARRLLADGADRRPRRRQVRRRLAGAELRDPATPPTPTGPSSTRCGPTWTPSADRYLDFEKWWGGHVTLNAAEMQFIVDQLFIGNRLAAGELTFSDGTRGRPAQHRLADHRLLLGGRRHHAAAAGALLGQRPLRRTSTTCARMGRPSSIPCTAASAISASSSPAAWRGRSTTSSRRTWT